MEDGKGCRHKRPMAAGACIAGSLQSIAVANWESAARSGPTLAGIGGWPAGRNSDLVVAVPLLGKDVRRRIEGDIGSGPLLTEVLFGHILRAVLLIGQTTRRTLNRGSVIETGIPELTTGGCAEVGALIGGQRELATLPQLPVRCANSGGRSITSTVIDGYSLWRPPEEAGVPS
jgi:hypothetical protein